MLQFTSLEDVFCAGLPKTLNSLVKKVVKLELSITASAVLNPDEGAVYLLEAPDNDQMLKECFGRQFSALLFESVTYDHVADSYLCRFLRDNQCCISLIVPNQSWLPESWRKTLQEELS